MILTWMARAAAAFFLFVGASTLASAETAAPLLWRVTDDDSEVFLLGTFHVLPPDLEWRSDALTAAFQSADTVYFEVEADAPGAQIEVTYIRMTQGMNADGVTLTSMLAPDEAPKLREIVTGLGLSYAGIDAMRPWHAFLTLRVQFLVAKGFEPGAGVDSALLADARAFGKELRFFETITEQLALFTELDAETERALLALTIRDWDHQVESFDALYKAWISGDAEFIDAEMNGVMRRQAPVVFDRMIVERNKAWADSIAQEMNAGGGKIFVAVGAGHLVGADYSVPALLAQKGFHVSRYDASEN
jgi:hypothetical protein